MPVAAAPEAEPDSPEPGWSMEQPVRVRTAAARRAMDVRNNLMGRAFLHPAARPDERVGVGSAAAGSGSTT
ncbi:hypothetical protein GCM10009596_19980 [Arthrobacter rhombi]